MPAIVATGTSVSIDLFSYYATENTFDGWVVEASINGGAFTNVGQAAWVINGYNNTISTAYQSPIAGQQAFSGSALAWTEHLATIPCAAGDNVVFRLNMSEDNSVGSTGVWIDDVQVFQGGPTGACCKGDGTCAGPLSSGDCTAQGGVAWFFGASCGSISCPPSGACCLGNGTCVLSTSANCPTLGGTYGGDGTTCSAGACAGACCHNDGTCSLTGASGCTASGGAYSGNGTTCASAGCNQYTVVNSVAGTFTDISGTGTPLTVTAGTIDDGTFAFTSTVTNALVTNANLYASTNGVISDTPTMTNYFNTALPFTAVPNGGAPNVTFAMYPNWDDLYVDSPGAVLQQGVVENGINVQIIEWSQVRTYTAGSAGPRGSFEVKIFGPGGPALAQYLFQADAWDWNGNSSTVGVQWNTNRSFQYTYSNTNSAGAQVSDNAVYSVVATATAPTCYPNCDHSTSVPFLNVADFTCFLQKFAAADAYANCDNSTTPPTLNVADFTCFLQKFAAGCSAP
jgi:hypothetical protein